ncbi:MAG: PaeR7I family type II restriction endonuclease [Candidatus Latescibacterota bacterium]|jgi:hypothetical protein
MPNTPDDILPDLPARISNAVAHYWRIRATQKEKQRRTGKVDQGLRSATTGGAQMDGFVDLITDLVTKAGIPDRYIFSKKTLELPGFFRPTKKWDLLVVRGDTLLAAIEVKSLAGPSFSNNLNNRVEEAMGSALDLWTAYRERAYLASPHPFLGYLFLLEDCGATNRPVKVREPHFRAFPEFVGASYMRRCELFCRKLVLERHYSAAAFVTSRADDGTSGRFIIPADDLTIERFARTLTAHLAAFA